MFSSVQSVLFCLCVFLYVAYGLDYSHLEALGVACPERDKCTGYRNNRDYTDRSCECDIDCAKYGDCCIDRLRRRNSSRPSSRITNLKCLNYGNDNHTGVYAISTCSSSWSGPREIWQRCVGPVDMRDPLKATPVTSINSNLLSDSVTYRNVYCAECNNADMESLTTFSLRMGCGLEDVADEQILADITYHEQLASWGVYRLSTDGRRNFFGCKIIFDVPSYLNDSVRFCRSNVISTCAPDWTRQVVRRNCDDYMAVVYDTDYNAYRNPHCALCNNKNLGELYCVIEAAGIVSRKRPMSFALLLDVNQSDGDQVGMRRVVTPECPSGHKYDPFFKRCRQLVCALPGHVVRDGRCVRG